MSGLRKHDPVPESWMMHKSPQCTVCQILRDIYRLTEDKEIRLKCRIATSMAKSMDKKLAENNHEYAKDFYDANTSKMKRAYGNS